MPVHGSGQFLEMAINSIISQEFQQPHELIVVLDKALPEAVAILETFSHETIKYVESQSSGVAHAHNAGLEAASFDLIAIAHSDDISLPGRFIKQAKFLNENPTIVCVGGQMRLINRNGIPIGFARYLTQPKQVRKVFRHKSSIAHPAAMYRRDLALKVGGYSQSYAPAEDLDLWLRMLELGDMANLSEEIVLYRQHPYQTSRESLMRQSFAKTKVYWDRKAGQREEALNLGPWQQFRFAALRNSESYIVQSVDQVRAKKFSRAILFVFLATVLNPVNMWRSLRTYLAVQQAKSRQISRTPLRKADLV